MKQTQKKCCIDNKNNIFKFSTDFSHINWITPASLIQQTFLIVMLFVYIFLSVSKRYKLLQQWLHVAYCASSYLECRIYPPWALINIEKPTRFRNKSKENCEEVMDTLLTKWEFCCNYLLYILYNYYLNGFWIS